jgi:hypothetical protein
LVKVPALEGLVRRRILLNYRADPEVVQRFLPAPFVPKLVNGAAVAGACLIRLEQLRPRALRMSRGVPIGWSSESAAYRIAVEWTNGDGERREGVYIPRRDTGSVVIHLLGGRLFPGKQGRARFAMRDGDGRIELSVRTPGGSADVGLRARSATDLPPSRLFDSVDDASRFFAAGAVGYSPDGSGELDGLRLCTNGAPLEPLAVEEFEAAFFADDTRFPAGSLEFDGALIMRDVPHEWHAEPRFTG